MAHEFSVEFEAQDGGPEPALRERFSVVASRRLQKLEEEGRPYPQAGDEFDFMDAFDGKYVWEMSDAEFEATPPTQVGVEVVSVEPSWSTSDRSLMYTQPLPVVCGPSLLRSAGSPYAASWWMP